MKALADAIGGAAAPEARARFSERAREAGLSPGEDAVELAALLSCAYPALAREVEARPHDIIALAKGGMKHARDAKTYRRLALAASGDLSDAESVRRGLRRFASREKMRVAAREVLAYGMAVGVSGPGGPASVSGADVDVTARELSDLADACMEVATDEALLWAERRFGVPTTAAGARCAFVVIGMGKLGGRELNAGSDVDILLFYETDEGEVRRDGTPTEQTLHEYFTRVAQRLTSTLDDVTEDGIVWRVDLRLRPEGSRGPLVNALAAAERYYETWGRTWERAALLRARPSAGDLAFGKEVLAAFAPFVWRREVKPEIADEMIHLTTRARAEMDGDPGRDLKLGIGGIREAEFFVQSLQLIWGGREPRVRSANTLDALRKLRARGFVTDREGRELADAYLALRRAEHRVQFATGVQTHALPTGPLLETIARSMGFESGEELENGLEVIRRTVGSRFESLSTEQAPESRIEKPLDRLWIALDSGSEDAIEKWLPTMFGASASPDLARHLLSLARRPDYLLGASTRDKHPHLPGVVLEALADSADPEQATRFMAAFFARTGAPTVYARALADDERAARRLASLFGASAFLGEAIVGHPELVDRLLFTRGHPDEESARRAVRDEVASVAEGDREDPSDAFVGALRRAKGAVTMEVGLADLAGELGTRDCTLVLSALADETLEQATRFALRERGLPEDRGLAVVAMGKLGGREIGYGSDLDLIFVYDGTEDDTERYIRVAQRVIRLVSTPHGDGPGYELDTRLRPSGSQGLLVVSRDAFARYHEGKAEAWERQALLKARPCAGDPELGKRVSEIAHQAAYEQGEPAPEKMHHLRMRMEDELARERKGRFDLKLGHGGLVDVEFAVQWLQMKHGTDRRVRSTDTETALAALEACGYLDAPRAGALREGYRFLRRLEQRLRVLHGTSVSLIEEGAPGLLPLARRMGMRDGPRQSAVDALLARYRSVTRDVRAAYLSVLGLAQG
jgi:glutamate-ammonia-ligase adenylyltransferase